nr:DUF6169 family protein [Bacteroidota bacterium]
MQPYKFTTVKDNYYEFTNAAGIKYACYFLSYAEYFKEYKEIANNVYAFNIDMLQKGTTSIIDPRIGSTIVQIIKTFLNGLTNAVVYVCDASDSKELFRKRKFDTWFREYDDGTIIKIDGHISIEDFNIYNAILIH